MAASNNKKEDTGIQENRIPTTVMTANRGGPIDDDDDDDDDYVRSRAPRTHRSHYPYYVVWKSATIPKGIYQCEWDELLAFLPNRAYPAKGLKLKGAKTLEDAMFILRENRGR